MPVYFVQAVDGGPVKIGHSVDIPGRMRALEGTYGRPLALLATRPGGREEERAIHKRFARLRFGKTEQFRPEPDLLEFIGRPLFASAVPVVEAMPARGGITLLNLKGSLAEREYLHNVSRITGVPATEIVRRGIAMWAKSRGLPAPPAHWVGA